MRLAAAASLVRQGARLADVGCDHGYVPVALVKSGRIPSAVACDINEKPLLSCRRLVAAEHLEDKIKCVLSDGLAAVGEEEADDILLAGMGGELIARILGDCPYVCKKHIVVNAMTHPELAREWAYQNGFAIQNDIILPDGRHHYCVFDMVYTGEIKAYTQTDCFLGCISDFSDKAYFIHLLRYLENKQKGGSDYAEVINAIKEKL